jgi:hypothetical protein
LSKEKSIKIWQNNFYKKKFHLKVLKVKLQNSSKIEMFSFKSLFVFNWHANKRKYKKPFAKSLFILQVVFVQISMHVSLLWIATSEKNLVYVFLFLNLTLSRFFLFRCTRQKMFNFVVKLFFNCKFISLKHLIIIN